MALQALKQDRDELPVPPAPQSRIARAISKVTGLYQEGVQRRNLNGGHDGNGNGQPKGYQLGFHDGDPDGLAEAGIEFTVKDDTVWVLPAGYRPFPCARDHARAFLAHLQSIEPLPGRWVSAWSLQFQLYPRFLEQINWPAQTWVGVAHQFRKLRGVKKRQRDRRTGADRTGSSPIEYYIPHRVRPSR